MILDSAGREQNGNGVDMSARQLAKYKNQNATIGEVNEIATEHAIRAVNHLANQIPKLVHHIVSQAIAGYHDALILRGIIPPNLPLQTLEQNMDHPQNPNPQPQHPHLQGGDTPLVKYVTEAEVEAIVLLVLGHHDTSRFWRGTPGMPGITGENLTTGQNLPLGVAPMAMTDPQSASVPSTDHGIQGTNLGTNG